MLIYASIFSLRGLMVLGAKLASVTICSWAQHLQVRCWLKSVVYLLSAFLLCLTFTVQETILCSLLPANHRRKLLHLPETEEPPSQQNTSEAILQWVLQVLIKPGHGVHQCERYLETQQFHPSLLSAICSHHLRFFRGHITCMLEHYLTYFKFTGKSSSAIELCDTANWVVIGTAGKVDVLVQNLKSLLEENKVMHDATIAMVAQHLKINW